MGGVQCCGFSLCVDGVLCYGKDDALMDNEDGQGETNKKPSKWCVDDSATERVFVPDSKSTHMPTASLLCSFTWAELFCLLTERRRAQVPGESERERETAKTERRSSHTYATLFSSYSIVFLRSLDEMGARETCIKIHF